ncbi:hypothetical protein, partial [Roseibium sp. RKSG952]|uniref:hypothetical protein n=1 Tax=Roseibium sp. RKSG952 TaxID=2529384 RepID=UPI001AD93D71
DSQIAITAQSLSTQIVEGVSSVSNYSLTLFSQLQSSTALAFQGIETQVEVIDGKLSTVATLAERLETTTTDHSAEFLRLGESIGGQETRLTEALTAVEGDRNRDVAQSLLDLLSGNVERQNADSRLAVSIHQSNVRIGENEAEVSRITADLAQVGNAATRAIDAVELRTTQTENTLETYGSRITSIQSEIDGLDDRTSGHAGAITSLNTSVSNINDTLTSQAQSLTSVSSKVDGNEASLTQQLSS